MDSKKKPGLHSHQWLGKADRDELRTANDRPGAPLGADLNFLAGGSGAESPRDSH
jgi:hypothetical protein